MTRHPTIIARPLSIKAIKVTLKDMKKDGLVKVPAYSKLCNKCIRNLFKRLQKAEAKKVMAVITGSAPPPDDDNKD